MSDEVGTSGADKANVEEAIRAFPFWPFNRDPFVRWGAWYVLRGLKGGRRD